MSMQPIITAFDTPVQQGQTLHLVGTGFGRVVGVVLVDVAGKQWEVDHQLDTGYSIHAYIPPLLPAGVYYPLLNTLDGTQSINQAGNITLPLSPTPSINPSVVFTDPTPISTSPAMGLVRDRLRLEIGDSSSYFQTSVQADGFSTQFTLPVGVITTMTVVQTLETGQRSVLNASTDYTVDSRSGTVSMNPAALPPPNDATLTFTGMNNQFYSDAELDLFIHSAALKHTHSAETLQRYIDSNGFRQYLYSDATVDTIAPVEYHPLALLAAIEALEVIRSDIAYDIDVSTAEGTSLPRTQRFRNVAVMIETKQAKYDELCAMLGVGLNRIEVFTMRRVSRQTGRLVPVWVNREYDERGIGNVPIRVLSPRNKGITGEGFDQPDPRAYYSNGSGYGY